MNYKIGLVGLPNVGKSSLFSFLTKKETLIANYPFSTIEKKVGIMTIPDERLEVLGEYWKSKKITPNCLEIFDIAGLVKKASEGLGMGNEFLSQVREVDLICHVVRCFSDEEIIHVEKNVDPLRDYQIIQVELILSDLQQINKSLEKKNKQNQKQIDLLSKIKDFLENGKMVSEIPLDKEEKKIIKGYNLLTSKPFMILANYGSSEEEANIMKEFAEREKIPFFSLPIGLELDTENLTGEEIEKIKLKKTDLYPFCDLIKKALNLKTFLTVGSDETKSWLVKGESNAKECGGAIHSDIKENFIRVEIYNYQDWLVDKKSPRKRKEGADYLVKEGDICYFLFGKNR